MPVYFNGSPPCRELVGGVKHRSRADLGESLAQCLHVGLVNNMPDGALQATERQFLNLLDSAANSIAVRLSLFALPDVPRTDSSRLHVNRFYSPLECLWESHLDGVIVTGTEPRAQDLPDEPYWGSFTRILDWAEHNTCSTIWSCLAAHGAVLHADGIERRRLSSKRVGIFECTRLGDHQLIVGLPSTFEMPHSRWNEISEEDLKDCGYTILTRSTDAGVDTFVRRKRSLFVFFQGHPEYEADTLLLEYRRDVRRYLTGKRATYPQIPHGYFDTETADALKVLGERARTEPSENLLDDIPGSLLKKGVENTWRSAAVRIYSNWLSYLSVMKEQSFKSRLLTSADVRGEEINVMGL